MHTDFSITLVVLLDFLLQVTAFVALIVFDCLRAEDNMIGCFPCIKIPSSSEGSDEGIFYKHSLHCYHCISSSVKKLSAA